MKMILDVDTGIDDALAIAYAIGNPEIDLIGVTCSFGNVQLETAVRNTLDVLHLFHREDIPVFLGQSCGITKDSYQPEDILYKVHGRNGIGNVELEKSPHLPETQSAVDFMIESARKYGKDLALVLVGPLSTIALAIRKDREAIKSVGKIVIMGGALAVCGNTTPYSECNIYNDIPAAQYFFESGIPFSMIGLDVTWKTLILGKDIESWKKSEAGKTLAKIAEHYYTNEFAEVGGALHDPLAVEAAVNPDIISLWFPTNLVVEDSGRTIANKRLINQTEKNVQVALDVQKEAFVTKFVRILGENL